MDIKTSYDNWGGKGNRTKILSGATEVLDGNENTYLTYTNGGQIKIDIIFSGLEGKLYIDCIKVMRTSYGFVDKQILLNNKLIGTFEDNIDSPLPILMIRKNDKITIMGRNNQSGGGTYATYIREIEFKTLYVPDKSFILHNSEYKKFNDKIPERPSTENLVPIMTSNIAPKGKVTAGNEYDPAWGAFDDGSKSRSFWYANSSASTNWLQYEFEKKTKVIRLSLTSTAVSGSNYGIRNFTILASNDGLMYDTLYTGTHPNNGNEIFYDLTNNKEYKSYKIQGDSYNSINQMLITSFKMFGEYIPHIPAHWSTVSNFLPKHNHFREEGMYLSPLLDRRVTILEPTEMTQRNDILELGEIGKVFSKTVDLKKYIDIRNITSEVK